MVYLFENEVLEIEDEVVRIVVVVWEVNFLFCYVGFWIKIGVDILERDVDFVGVCIGVRGLRI